MPAYNLSPQRLIKADLKYRWDSWPQSWFARQLLVMSRLSLGDSCFPPWVSPGHHLQCSEGTFPNKPQQLVHPHRLCQRCPETLCSDRAGSAQPEPWAGWMVSGDPARTPPLPPLDRQGHGTHMWSLSLGLWSSRDDRVKLQAPVSQDRVPQRGGQT